MPLRCHFLHFGITVNGNIAPKVITGSWPDAKGVKVAEKPQKIGKEAGGRYFRNFWVGMCRWDPEIVNLYTELQVVQLNVVTLY